MQWFEGSIPDAIKQSQQNKSVFVVYIEGKFNVDSCLCDATHSLVFYSFNELG